MNLKIAKDDEKMAEYIDMDDVLETIRYRVCQGQGNKEHICQRGSCAYCGIMEIMSDVSALPTADVQPVDRWIRTAKSLPEVGQPVLIYYDSWDGDEVSVAKLEDDKLFFNVCGEFDVSVRDTTHWQPLPIVPRKEEKHE